MPVPLGFRLDRDAPLIASISFRCTSGSHRSRARKKFPGFALGTACADDASMRALFLAVVLIACGGGPPDSKQTAVSSGANPGTKATSFGLLNAPISGGTLLLDAGGTHRIFASNPDRDVVDVLDLNDGSTVWQAELPSGSEPGRLIRDDAGLVHVALRRGDAIATLDVAARSVTIRPACANPRGLAAMGSTIYVACARGELAILRARGGSTARIPSDARDVLVGRDGFVYVTRFRSAGLVKLDPEGNVVDESKPPSLSFANEVFVPHVAWRARTAPDGSIWVLHQYETTRVLPTTQVDPMRFPYGPNGAGCDGRPVQAAITRFEDGKPTGTSLLPFASPSVDFDIDPPASVIVSAGGGYGPSALLVSLSFDATNPKPTCATPIGAWLTRSVVSVERNAGTDELYLQVKNPSAILGMQRAAFAAVPHKSAAREMKLSSAPTARGFEIFHTPTAAGIACVSCHAEGGDDGHTWRLGDPQSAVLRRTPALRGGLLSTAPFHWDGALADIHALADDVFATRMGGTITPQDADALATWLDSIPALAPSASLDPESVKRGSAAFDTAGCSNCHHGSHFTNNKTMDVGTGGGFQVPSLLGVGVRTPLLHDGCAETIQQRLTDPTCAGTKHGALDLLDAQAISDLAVYLESL
jgi:hypothetical protein